MVFLKVLILILTFNESIVDLDARTCVKGHKVDLDGSKCVSCSEDYYQDVDNDSKQCRPCTRCSAKKWSVIKQTCNRETDTICQCLGGFVPWGLDASNCKCEKGFGIRTDDTGIPQCLKCEKGFFSNAVDTRCQQWKDCKSAGVKVRGSETSDNVCNEELKNETHIPEPKASTTVVPFTRLTTHRPHEGAQTQRKTTTTTTTSAPRPATTKDKMQPPSSSNSGSHIGMALLIFGISGLLVLTVVTCRLHIITRWQRKPPAPKDSLCRRPVEESGDGSRSSLKLNPEEP